MKTTTSYAAGLLAVCAIASGTLTLNAQQIQFTSVSRTSEGAVQLAWTSESNAVYEIQYTDSLNDPISWSALYDGYPSHGTNTFIADAGNYDVTPEISHPKKSPMRFYRIALAEYNTSASNPTVAIQSPTNGATVSGVITVKVSAASSAILTDRKLYIDGEEQWSSEDGTNFVINTCEWTNGTHSLFATAKSQSGLEGVANGGDITYGRAVSSYIKVTFDNLINEFLLSEVYFEPSLGQTQVVSAAFAVGVDWTLEIQNDSSNTVRTATGSGKAMQFNWDGKDDNSANLPDGAYTYLLTAQTNGQSYALSAPSGGESFSVAALRKAASKEAPQDQLPTSVEEALALGQAAYFVEPPPMPPVGIETNGEWVSVPWESVYGPVEPIKVEITSEVQENFLQFLAGETVTTSAEQFESSGAQSYSGGASQSARAPGRKPETEAKGTVGTVGILYKTYGTNGFASLHPTTGWPFPLPTRVAIDGQSATATTVDKRLLQYDTIAKDFAATMKQGAWKPSFVLRDDKWSKTDVKKASLGGNSIFNTVNFGMLMTHGSYATTAESDSVKYTYFWLLTLSNNVSEYLRLSDLDFGSSDTNGLKWMTVYACNILRPDNYNSMNNAGKIPVNENLHLLLGPSTTAYACNQFGLLYANDLTRNKKTVIGAFNRAGTLAHTFDRAGVTNVVKFAACGWPACFSDKLSSASDPDPINGLTYQETLIFTP